MMVLRVYLDFVIKTLTWWINVGEIVYSGLPDLMFEEDFGMYRCVEILG